MKPTYERAFLASAIVMTIGLTLVAATPSSADIVGSALHRPAHIAAYAMVAFAWTRGLPMVSAPLMMLAGVALGFAHEALEIVGHRHPFELADAFYDAAGAITGVIVARFSIRKANVGRRSLP